MAKVILVRHGETNWNRLRRLQGAGNNPRLNKKGKHQAESLALKLKRERLQAIYSSPLQRARDTAQAIARHHQVEVETEPALSEIDVGELEGVPIAKVGRHLDQLLTTGDNTEALSRMPGGESLAEVQQRAWSTVQRLGNKHPDGVIVVVSHYFAILTIICAVLNLPLSQIGRLRLDVGGISTIVLDEQVTRLTLFNENCR